jgi:hypothetical protein
MKSLNLAFAASLALAVAWLLLAARSPAALPSAAPQFGCTCHATMNELDTDCSGCGISYSGISTTNAACTPTCQVNGNYCSAEAIMTFSGCSTNAYSLKALAPCDSTGNARVRCPNDPAHFAGIEVVCAACTDP